MTNKDYKKLCKLLPPKIVKALKCLEQEIDNYFLKDKRIIKSQYKISKDAIQHIIVEMAAPLVEPFLKRCVEKMFELSLSDFKKKKKPRNG